MATFFYRQKHSRRRLAALNFLSNISLDGSFQNIGQIESTCKTTLSKQSFSYDDRDLNNTNKERRISKQKHVDRSCSGRQSHLRFNEVNLFKGDSRDLLSEKPSFEQEKLIKEEITNKSSLPKLIGERSIQLHATQKTKVKSTIHSNVNLCHLPAIIDNGALTAVAHNSEKLKSDCYESSTPGYLHPNPSCCQKISSNTSESSYSPTGSGAKEKEVKFLASSCDLSSHMVDQRLVLVTCQCSPVVLFSTLPFSRISKLARGDFRGESGRRRHTSSGTRPVSSTEYPDLYQLLGLTKPGDGQVISYSQMLVPTNHLNRELGITRRLNCMVGDHSETEILANKLTASCYRYSLHEPITVVYRSNYNRSSSPLQTMVESMKSDGEEGNTLHFHSSSGNSCYHPSLLDDPELIVGKHSTRISLLTFSSYMTSVIDYVKPSDLKKELNEKFREKFPHIHLTLSKIRSLKREMRKVAKQDSGTDLLTVAQSYVYFEKLILRGLVHKGNRKLCAGATLLLSAKMNDVKGDTLRSLIEEIQNNFRISRRELFVSEFAVLVALEFSLHSPIREIFSHYQRLLYES